MELGKAETARRYLEDTRQVLTRVEDVGVMRDQYADLMARLDALGLGAGDVREPEPTERELEVLALLPSPLTIREMADELFVWCNTIKTHVRRLYRKLHATSRKEAVLIARDRGLL